MGHVKIYLIGALVAWSTFSVGIASGQIVYGQSASAKIRVILTSWEAGGEGGQSSLDQIYVPFSGFIPLRDNLEARFFLGGVTNKLDDLGESRKLSGPTDTRLQVNKSFSDDRFIFSVGLNLPTGKTGLNFDEEWHVTNFLAQDFLNYPNRRLGGGLGMNALLGSAAMAGDFRLGASVLYHYTGSYEAYENNGDYDPGNFYSLSAGFKRPFERITWISDITFTSYTDDKQDDLKIYNRGNQILFRMGGVWATPDLTASADARYFVRDRNAVFDLAGVTINQLQLYGNEFSLLGNVSWFFDDKNWELGPMFSLRMIAANEYELGNASNIGIGAQAKKWLNPRYQLGLSFKYLTGSADGGDIDLSGYQIATSLSGLF